MSDEQKKYDQRTQDHEGTPRVFDKEIKEFNREKFGGRHSEDPRSIPVRR